MFLIKNGTVVDPSVSSSEQVRDVLVENGRIKDVVVPGQIADDMVQETLNAQGCWVVPGLIDIHVHLREPGYEWKETIASGVRSAVKGGFTRVCCMPNTKPVNDCPEITKFILAQAKAAGLAHVHPIGAVTTNIAGKELTGLSDLADAGCVAFSDDGNPVYDPEIMRRALEWCRHLAIPITCHEEVTELTRGGCMNESALSYRLGLKGMPAAAEDIMVARDIELARLTGGRVHICHISSGRSVELVRRAKQDGLPVTAEVTMHHLMMNESAVEGFNTSAKMSPPLRTEEDRLALLAGVVDGTIEVIASDHAPHDLESKRVEFARAAFGILGFPTTLALLLELVHEKTLTIGQAIAALTCNPAKVFSLDGGTLRKGSIADVTIIDPAVEWVFKPSEVVSKSKNSPFFGRQFKGRVRDVVIAGKVVLKDQEILGVSDNA